MDKLKELNINAQEQEDVFSKERNIKPRTVTQHFIQVVIQADIDTVLVGDYTEFDNDGNGEYDFYYKYTMSDLNIVMNELLPYHDLEVQLWDETEWGEHATVEPYDYINKHVNKDIKK